MNGMDECQTPKVLFVMLGPTKGSVDHHRTRGPYIFLDCILSDAVVVMATDDAMVDCLTGEVNTIFSTIFFDMNANGSTFFFKLNSCLYCLRTSQADLMND